MIRRSTLRTWHETVFYKLWMSPPTGLSDGGMRPPQTWGGVSDATDGRCIFHSQPVFYRVCKQFAFAGVNQCIRYRRCARRRSISDGWPNAFKGPQMSNLTTCCPRCLFKLLMSLLFLCSKGTAILQSNLKLRCSVKMYELGVDLLILGA